MTSDTASQAFVDVAAAMVGQDDIAGTLSRLGTACAQITSAAAIGLLVKNGTGRLELLSATSHAAAELELYQLQHDTGPCLDAVRDEKALSAHAGGEIAARWGRVGEAIVGAGFHALHAVPLRWQGRVIGAMNAFHTDPRTVSDGSLLLTQAFADLASIVILQPTELTANQLDGRLQAALEGRTVIEQAKGVLAQTDGVDMATAYRLLVQRADADMSSLTQVAAELVKRGQKRS
jgi:GAF domain-containing protein